MTAIEINMKRRATFGGRLYRVVAVCGEELDERSKCAKFHSKRFGLNVVLHEAARDDVLALQTTTHDTTHLH
jgi:hypothetical protein